MSSRASAPGHFGLRLQQALDRTAIPPRRQRTTALASHYAVDRETARLWLAGRAMPDVHRLVEIADDCRVSLDWLATGRGPMVAPAGAGEQAQGLRCAQRRRKSPAPGRSSALATPPPRPAGLARRLQLKDRTPAAFRSIRTDSRPDAQMTDGDFFHEKAVDMPYRHAVGSTPCRVATATATPPH